MNFIETNQYYKYNYLNQLKSDNCGVTTITFRFPSDPFKEITQNFTFTDNIKTLYKFIKSKEPNCIFKLIRIEPGPAEELISFSKTLEQVKMCPKSIVQIV